MVMMLTMVTKMFAMIKRCHINIKRFIIVVVGGGIWVDVPV